MSQRTVTPTLFVALAVFLVSAGCGITGPEQANSVGPQEGDTRILFIGSSYLAVNDLPWLFTGLARAAGKQVFVGERVQSGFYLDFFAGDAATNRAIEDQDWDFIILSGGCQTAAYPNTHHMIKEGWGHHDPYPALKAFKDKVSEVNPETVLIYMMPWAFEDGITWIPGQTDDYFSMQESIRANALRWAEELDLSVAPVGMAWGKIMEQGVPVHYLHEPDWNHPNPRGSFLSAATLFSTVFKERGDQVEFSWLLPPNEAENFLKVGSDTVLDSLALWNIGY
jgi:hypothetical protein